MGATLIKKARELYNSSPAVKPEWEKLGDTTKGVWMGYVQAGITPKDYQPKKVKK